MKASYSMMLGHMYVYLTSCLRAVTIASLDVAVLQRTMHEVSGIAGVGRSQGAWNPPKLYHFTQLELLKC